MTKKAQVQIDGHMRVCIGAPDERTPVHSIAASETILSEVASLVMRHGYKFYLPDALLDVLDTYAISHGDRGELLVAAFFTGGPTLQFIWTFDVLLDSSPSICHHDFSPQTFEEVSRRTRMHFNHHIKPFKQEVFVCPYLVALIARSAAALVANFQPGSDMVYLFLYEINDLLLLDKEDSSQFTIPIFRFLFELGGEELFVQQQTYASTKDGAATLDAYGWPFFTSYDLWCSGLGLGLF
ncbi:hypothetical protein BJY52DRAFT_1352771 [Lactarius psammicola]|nr:hypothetical protein BJY52DRAFT_1352771 [Lactarius psammicola]